MMLKHLIKVFLFKLKILLLGGFIMLLTIVIFTRNICKDKNHDSFLSLVLFFKIKRFILANILTPLKGPYYCNNMG